MTIDVLSADMAVNRWRAASDACAAIVVFTAGYFLVALPIVCYFMPAGSPACVPDEALQLVLARSHPGPGQ